MLMSSAWCRCCHLSMLSHCSGPQPNKTQKLHDGSDGNQALAEKSEHTDSMSVCACIITRIKIDDPSNVLEINTTMHAVFSSLLFLFLKRTKQTYLSKTECTWKRFCKTGAVCQQSPSLHPSHGVQDYNRRLPSQSQGGGLSIATFLVHLSVTIHSSGVSPPLRKDQTRQRHTWRALILSCRRILFTGGPPKPRSPAIAGSVDTTEALRFRFLPTP